MEGWRGGRMEGWKGGREKIGCVGMLEGWNVGSVGMLEVLEWWKCWNGGSVGMVEGGNH